MPNADRLVEALRTLVDEAASRVVNEMRRDLDERVAHLERQHDDLVRTVDMAVAVVTALVEDLRSSNGDVLGMPLPRPPELDAACAADGPQTVVLDVYDRQVVQRVEPGSDPDQLWRDICASVTRHAVRRSREGHGTA